MLVAKSGSKIDEDDLLGVVDKVAYCIIVDKVVFSVSDAVNEVALNLHPMQRTLVRKHNVIIVRMVQIM